MRKHYLLIVLLGGFAIALSVLGGLFALNHSLERKANVLGMDWGRYIENKIEKQNLFRPGHGADQPLSEIERRYVVRAFESVLSVGHIFQIDLYGVSCDCHIGLDAIEMANSPNFKLPAHHLEKNSSAHSHNVYHAEFRTFGGIPTDLAALNAMALANARTIEILRENAPSLPSTYAAIHHTVLTDGAPAYILRLMVNLERQNAQFSTLIFFGMATGGLILALGIGFPLWRLLHSMKTAREADARAAFLAKHDVLTGLHNRNS
ncbi:MAG: hypothetical protein OXD48_04120, partial [Litoreibacter sp.]|nr:hypothetical protein [Litoreibacter sp.]